MRAMLRSPFRRQAIITIRNASARLRHRRKQMSSSSLLNAPLISSCALRTISFNRPANRSGNGAHARDRRRVDARLRIRVCFSAAALLLCLARARLAPPSVRPPPMTALERVRKNERNGGNRAPSQTLRNGWPRGADGRLHGSASAHVASALARGARCRPASHDLSRHLRGAPYGALIPFTVTHLFVLQVCDDEQSSAVYCCSQYNVE